jgi:acid phosphatase type 7
MVFMIVGVNPAIRRLKHLMIRGWKIVLISVLVFLLNSCQSTVVQNQSLSPDGTLGNIPVTQNPNALLSRTRIHPIAASPTPSSHILVGAGDISICGQKGDDQTADLLANIPGTIFSVGDNSNESGTAYEYLNCFGPSWGQFLDRLYPVPGNHDYVTDNASPYFDYFSGGPLTRGKGYYSYDLGSWHVIALNSVIDISTDSLQVAWVREDLASHKNLCTLAYWHHPRWTSGESGNDGRMAAIWQILYAHGVDVVVNGNEHMYERFAPLDPDGKMDLTHGIREFVVGTGGASHYRFGIIQANSQVRENSTFGVLKFDLLTNGYDWEFIPVEGMDFTDTGSDACH